MTKEAVPLVVVLDTNVVIDWLVFDDPAVRPLVRAVQSGSGARVVTSAECLAELERVLGYPAFKLEPPAQAAALARFRSHALPFDDPPAERSGLPLCADPDDQKFLELAWHARASYLVTRDKALLCMARKVRRFGRFSIETPAALNARPVFPTEAINQTDSCKPLT